MIYIAEIGEKVIYTGDLSYATNEVTATLMKQHLIKDCLYEVKDIRRFHCEPSGNGSVKHYKIKKFWAPCESFKMCVGATREKSRKKYNLK